MPDSRIDRIITSPMETQGGDAGMVLVIEFTLAGRRRGTAKVLQSFSSPKSRLRFDARFGSFRGLSHRLPLFLCAPHFPPPVNHANPAILSKFPAPAQPLSTANHSLPTRHP
ncbi:hypothetical protein [Prosthecobacter algae]|uniref:hypothetical protein n=1 Tax=Prosthecobacter algae TaxID=1144682 RepID=UPI0031EF4DB7